MNPDATAEIEPRLPTRREAVVFRGKTAVFQLREMLRGGRAKRWKKSDVTENFDVVAESRQPLVTGEIRNSESDWQAGKIQNLRVAARFLDRLKIPAGETFSFWAHVPRPTRRHGFTIGRELREGCLVPSVGGGLCQLSNGLYDGALKANLEIVERHAHSRKIPGSAAEAGRDATIFWNYVDLKFRADRDWQLRVFLDRHDLVVRFLAREKIADLEEKPVISVPDSRPEAEVRSCDSCGMTSCFRHHANRVSSANSTQTAWLVDAFWPEFDQFISEEKTASDWIFTPLARSRKFGRGRYPWTNVGFANVVDFPFFVLRRALKSRRLATQGAERQRANLRFSEQLADKMAAKIPPTAERVVVCLDLLPFLWKTGVLGGRRFEVLMTRWPMLDLQKKLDAAAACWPESPTLADFRVDENLAALEQEALAEAASWITPHPEIADAAPPEKRRKLAWATEFGSAEKGAKNHGEHFVFPVATAGRNGVWELREALRSVDFPLKIAGPIVEGTGFWEGLPVSRIEPGADWLAGAKAVVFPAWISHRPGRLLQALAAGVPVITTAETGISDLPGVTIVPTGDVSGLISALRKIPFCEADV